MSSSPTRCTLAPIPETPARACIIHPFQRYLDQQQLSWPVVAREAEVPCLIVWNIAHGVQVSGASAMRVRVAVHRLSEVAYTGPIQTQAGLAQAVRTTGTLPLTKETRS